MPPNKTIKITILHQDEVWLPLGATQPTRLRKMEPGHIANLLAFLDKRKKQLKFADEWRWTVVAANHDGGEMAQDALDNIAERTMEQSEEDWFNELPLVIELRRLKAKYDKKLLPDNFTNAVARYRYEINRDRVKQSAT